MKTYQLVLREKNGKYWAFYCEANQPPVYDFDGLFVVDSTVKGALKKARAIAPDDGWVAYTYIDRT